MQSHRFEDIPKLVNEHAQLRLKRRESEELGVDEKLLGREAEIGWIRVEGSVADS
jgi:hypothetical protein